MNTKFSLIEHGSLAFRILDGIADATNVLLLAWLLGVLLLGLKRKALGARAWLAVLLSIAGVYIIKTLDSKIDLWELIGANYSTHSAFAAAAAISLFFLDGPRRFWALGVFAVYEILVLLLGFHSLLDIGSTLLVIAPIVWLIFFRNHRSNHERSNHESGVEV